VDIGLPFEDRVGRERRRIVAYMGRAAAARQRKRGDAIMQADEAEQGVAIRGARRETNDR
jgi:hypothetical protein